MEDSKTELVRQLKRFENYLNTVTKPIEEHHGVLLRTKINSLAKIKTELETCIQDAKEQRNIDRLMEFEEIEDLLLVLEARSEHILSTESQYEVVDQWNGPRNSTVSTHAQTNIKLPTISLVKFDGSFENWVNFYETFDSLINQNESLSTIQKFHYLKSTLEKEACSLINHLDITPGNYHIAWSMLKDRYQNKRLIIKKHLSALLDSANIVKESQIELRQLIDSATRNLLALQQLNEPVDHWSTVIVHILSQKLDQKTRREWETASNGTDNLGTFNDFKRFIYEKCNMLEAIGAKTPTYNPVSKRYVNINTTIQPDLICSICKGNHKTIECTDLIDKSIGDRQQLIKRLKLCFNCLRPNHASYLCRSRHSCHRCHKRHHTLLHNQNDNSQNSTRSVFLNQAGPSNASENLTENHVENISPKENAIALNHNVHSFAVTPAHVLLSTAIVKFKSANENSIAARVLIDNGSQVSVISTDFINRLGIQPSPNKTPLFGVGDAACKAHGTATLSIESTVMPFKKTLQFLVMDRVTGELPTGTINLTDINIPNIELADKQFHITQKIDGLLSAEIFFEILLPGQVKVDNLIFQNTKLGWLAGGRMNKIQSTHAVLYHIIPNLQLENDIQNFWRLDREKVRFEHMSNEQKECETHFVNNVYRDIEGKFVAKLPFNDNKSKLGSSYEIAQRRFFSLERKLDSDVRLKNKYVDFMREYFTMGHMHKILQDSKNQGYYLPHHAIIKEKSLSTRLRVVFDASAKTTTGVSLNDALMGGPVIQPDLFTILCRFRTYQYALNADIEKMYRKIVICSDDREYQKILWRENKNDALESFKLATLTYGTKPASFIATRCLLQLSQDAREQFPLAARAIAQDFYMDDILTGANDLSSCRQLRDELISVLKTADFNLRKWNSNSTEAIDDLKCEDPLVLIKAENSVKTLGLLWNSPRDFFEFQIKSNRKPAATKREILSEIASLFDPLGLIGPVILIAKLIMQSMWKIELNWDENVPLDIKNQWDYFSNELPFLEMLRVPRKSLAQNYNSTELHCFGDASELAYGGVIYLVSVLPDGTRSVALIASKSRVAPLKRITLPRLELCAALTVARLLDTVKEALNIELDSIFLYSDSTIVLHWLNTSPHRLKTFVSNRVSEIQELTTNCHWHHINSEQNPADIISRGKLPSHLINCSLWWAGPEWLLRDVSERPISSRVDWVKQDAELEFKASDVKCFVNVIDLSFPFFNQISSFTKIVRIVAYCRRFISKTKPTTSYLNVNELRASTKCIIKILQKDFFNVELGLLQKGKEIQGSSKILSLNPFLDSDNVIRVGGRLRHSSLSPNQKHPILLPKCHITNQIILETHKHLMHAGTESVLAEIRTKYWPIAGRRLVRNAISKCIDCRKARPKFLEHLTGDLPEVRVRPATRCFERTGVDFAGPVSIKEKRSRGRNAITKGYICIFICLATKAVHLELATDLSSACFLAALRRFTSRRGVCHQLMSDNGTNFIGCNRELKQLYSMFKEQHEDLGDELTKMKIEWKFLPPRAPHFAGIWERMVRTVKRHLNHITKNVSLTFEEYYTILTQIEAIVNCRPITQVSADPNDLEALTPAHFLIGESLISPPDREYGDVADNRLPNWQRLQKIRGQFWKRFSRDYLHQLQQRPKWQRTTANIQVGSLVIIQENQVPPMYWKLGRVIDIFQGKDKVVRVATVKTANGTFKRPVRKLCVLPIEAQP